MNSLSQQLGQPAGLDDIPDQTLSHFAELGFNWLYFLGAWKTGQVGLELARTNPELRDQILQILPDVCEDEICSSCFAIAAYHIPEEWGGDAALERLSQRLHCHGLRLMLDFVPNHTAIDHPWVYQHPEYYIEVSPDQLQQSPNSYTRVDTMQGIRILAHGRDPFFSPWTDTLQLNYGNPALQAAMTDELCRLADCCDGLRCDMTMLVMPEVFERTWGILASPFWPQAIRILKQRRPDFTLLAEVYWDLEPTLLKQGFDFAYDKRLYDYLHNQHAFLLRETLSAPLCFQQHLVRFLENHDESRAANVFPPNIHQAAAIIAYLSPGMHFFQLGQLQGHQFRIPVQLCRSPAQARDALLELFYLRLLSAMKQAAPRLDSWQLIHPSPAWEGNWTWEGFIAFTWQSLTATHWLAVVNYSPHQSQCYLRLPISELSAGFCCLNDWFHPLSYERSVDDLLGQGLYLDMPAWGYHLFEITTQEK